MCAITYNAKCNEVVDVRDFKRREIRKDNIMKNMFKRFGNFLKESYVEYCELMAKQICYKYNY
ncbi:MAG: hypothetical protein E7309_12500 [Butyrivibrio sp.]|nr:hypothetical protein [Butyrivibrio sp.]